MSADGFTIFLEPDENRESATFLHARLSEFNAAHTGDSFYRPLVLVARNVQAAIVGGLLGDIYWEALAINILWVHEDWRGRGLGAALVACAENEARAAGCRFVHVDTMAYQAPGFYQKLGYVVFGELGPYNGQYTRYYLKKHLGDA